MKMRNLFVLPAICCALALTPGACGGGKQENAKGARLRRGVAHGTGEKHAGSSQTESQEKSFPHNALKENFSSNASENA